MTAKLISYTRDYMPVLLRAASQSYQKIASDRVLNKSAVGQYLCPNFIAAVRASEPMAAMPSPKIIRRIANNRAK